MNEIALMDWEMEIDRILEHEIAAGYKEEYQEKSDTLAATYISDFLATCNIGFDSYGMEELTAEVWEHNYCVILDAITVAFNHGKYYEEDRNRLRGAEQIEIDEFIMYEVDSYLEATWSNYPWSCYSGYYHGNPRFYDSVSDHIFNIASRFGIAMPVQTEGLEEWADEDGLFKDRSLLGEKGVFVFNVCQNTLLEKIFSPEEIFYDTENNFKFIPERRKETILMIERGERK